ncbi:MAG: NCS2 family permease [Acidimicrobiia bacterium]|nr:NCS2 family permease [Acidimicrobiia bacterium]
MIAASRPRWADIAGGVTTFVTMAYIVVVNPAILSAPGTGIPFAGAASATVLVACSMTLLMGAWAKLPFAVAPGMGLNALVAYTIILGDGVPWQTAFGIVFWAGVLFLVVSMTPLREQIATAIPAGLRLGVSAGIGLLLTVIGLRAAGLVAPNEATMIGPGAFDHRGVLLLAGLATALVLMRRNSPLAFLSAIGVVSGAAWVFGFAQPPDRLLSPPDFSSVFLQLDVVSALAPALWPSIAAVLFTDLFDSLATFIGVATAAGLTDKDGRPLHLRRGLIVDAWATMTSGLAGTSSGTAFVESLSGIRMGGRSGWASVVTAGCFLPCFFIAPLAGAIPEYATAAVLVLVGVAMFQSAAGITFSKIEEALPAFLTLILIPLTFSITQGLLWGFVSQPLAFAVSGRAREVSPALWALAVLAAGLLLLH